MDLAQVKGVWSEDLAFAVRRCGGRREEVVLLKGLSLFALLQQIQPQLGQAERGL